MITRTGPWFPAGGAGGPITLITAITTSHHGHTAEVNHCTLIPWYSDTRTSSVLIAHNLGEIVSDQYQRNHHDIVLSPTPNLIVVDN